MMDGSDSSLKEIQDSVGIGWGPPYVEGRRMDMVRALDGGGHPLCPG